MTLHLDEAIYAFFLRRRRARFAANAVRVANCVVISVGNLNSGGTGKTPMVQHLARGLQRRGRRVAVVSRGHGGALSKNGAVVSDGKTLFCDARQAGDETVLHARSLPGIAVVIGRNRVAATEIAARELGCDTILLDDGFQFWSLQRDFDLVLLDARRPLGDGHLLPRGLLREPFEALQRADAIVFTRADCATADELAQNRVLVARHSEAPVFSANHRAVGLRDESKIAVKKVQTSPTDSEITSFADALFSLGNLRDVKIAALSAIANNSGFMELVRAAGAKIVAMCGRRDHHAWRESEVRHFVSQAREKGAFAVVTTEKDAVKLSAEWCAPLPLWSVALEIEVTEDAQLWAQIESSAF